MIMTNKGLQIPKGTTTAVEDGSTRLHIEAYLTKPEDILQMVNENPLPWMIGDRVIGKVYDIKPVIGRDDLILLITPINFTCGDSTKRNSLILLSQFLEIDTTRFKPVCTVVKDDREHLAVFTNGSYRLTDLKNGSDTFLNPLEFYYNTRG